MMLKSILTCRMPIPVWEQLITDQNDLWQVVPKTGHEEHSFYFGKRNVHVVLVICPKETCPEAVVGIHDLSC